MSGPPENIAVITRNATFLEYQWHYPNQSNGLIKSFMININEIETYDNSKCCTSFPILEVPMFAEELIYQAEVILNVIYFLVKLSL